MTFNVINRAEILRKAVRIPFLTEDGKIVYKRFVSVEDIEAAPDGLDGSAIKKCKDCKYLSDEKASIGRRCVCPTKEWKYRSAQWKQPCGRACKKFEPREAGNGV